MTWYSKKLSEVTITDHLRCVICGGFLEADHNKHIVKVGNRPPLCSPRCVARYDDECATLGVLYLRPLDYARRKWYGCIWYDIDGEIHLELCTPEKHGVIHEPKGKK